MPTQRRHGLPTLLVTGDPDVRGAVTDHLLTGRKTVVLRPVPDPDHEPLERAGDRVLLVDDAGRSLAVADVVSATLATLADVDAPTRRADDPDHLDEAGWTGAQLARWRTAGLLADADSTGTAGTDAGSGTDLAVAVVRVRVVGLETAPASSTEGDAR
jgi:hypothetical protein